MEFISTIPAEVLEDIQERKVIEAGFGAGPSCVAGKVQVFPDPVELAEGVAWIEKYCHIMKAAHLLLDDRTVLWFHPTGFKRYEQTPVNKPPRPGVEITTSG
jgi:hypothetical protein